MALQSAPSEVLSSLQSERVFRYLVESIGDYAIFMLDPAGHVATWNLGAERIKGYKAKEIIGQHFSKFYPQVDLDNDKPAFELREAERTGRFEDEGWRLRNDGSRFWANVIITTIRDEQGKLIGFGKVTRDLTERRAAEVRYRLLIEAVTDYAIYSLDADGHITSWNAGAERIKQYTSEEIIGKHFSIFYTPEDRAKGMPQFVLHTAATEGHFEGEGWRVRKNGSRFWSSVVVTPVRDDEGKVVGYSKITRDVTDRKELLDRIREHAEELEVQIAEREQTNAELEAFSYSVSHDLRAPIRAITGFADALREEYGDRLDATAHEYLQHVLDGAARMNRLVEDLLNYSRLSRTELLVDRVSVARVTAAALKSLGATDGSIKVNVPDKAEVLAHEPTLRQTLYNLIHNALKFRRPNVAPEVTVSYSGKGNFGRVSVKDNGIGIAPQHQDRIFQVFERLHGTEEFPGTGIGLAIVKRAVERMGGRICIESQLGRGSTFWIDLPLAGTTK
ncbi:MAG: sensor histidine kinase [Terriglobales bacterium]